MPQHQFSVDWPQLVETNVARTCSAMASDDVDVLVVNHIDNVRYLTGYSPVSAPILVLSNWVALARETQERTLFGFEFYVDSVRAKFPWIPDVRPLVADMGTAIADWVREQGGATARVGLDGYVPHGVARELERLLPEAELVNADGIVAATRSVKTDDELAILRRAVAIGEIGMEAAIDACVQGTKEYEVAAEAEYAMRSAGAEGFSVSSVVTSGENGALMQELATDKFLRRGEVVFLDLGCMFEGYYSDFARTVLVGAGAATDEQRRIYRAVMEARDRVVAEIRAGTTCGRLDEVARQAIDEAGFGEFGYVHFLGHGLGMSVWEAPVIAGGSHVELLPNMVVNVEPGIYKPGAGGFRIEETVIVGQDDNEVLTRTGYCDALLEDARQ